jgi:hypothetical protein
MNLPTYAVARVAKKAQNEKTRQILFWAHAIIGGVFSCFYLWRTNRPLTSVFLPSAGVTDLIIGLPAIIPFIAADADSRKHYSRSRATSLTVRGGLSSTSRFLLLARRLPVY